MSSAITAPSVEPEMLDNLPEADPRAIRARRVRRINRVMAAQSILCRGRRGDPRRPPADIELGAGDARCCARRRAGVRKWPASKSCWWSGRSVARTRESASRSRLESARRPPRRVRLSVRTLPCRTLLFANFPAHFAGDALARAFASGMQHRVVAFEPRRAATACSQPPSLCRCNAVTRNDAVLILPADFAMLS